MDKLKYLAKTLSRTKRKDYENYVVNAVWNRLACPELKPVTQQYIRSASSDDARERQGYFIDLYFPQLNIGVECDEPFHLHHEEEDGKREVAIADILHQVDDTSNYQAFHVDVSKGYESVELQIDECVLGILGEMEERKRRDAFCPWDDLLSAANYYSVRDCIEVGDEVGFETIAEACNVVFGSGYEKMQRAFFKPRGVDVLDGVPFVVWFPKLVVDGKSASRGWLNTISEDGSIIWESHEDAQKIERLEEDEEVVRIVFARTQDQLTREFEYQFAGVFQLVGKDMHEGRNCRVYKRVKREVSLKKTHEKPVTEPYELLRFIEVLDHKDFGSWVFSYGHAGTVEDPIPMPYVLYSNWIMQFEDAIYSVTEAHPEYELTDYFRILEKNGLEWGSESLASADVSEADEQCVLAMLLSIVRAERFSDGTLLEFLKNGHIQRWLKRLQELIQSGE